MLPCIECVCRYVHTVETHLKCSDYIRVTQLNFTMKVKLVIVNFGYSEEFSVLPATRCSFHCTIKPLNQTLCNLEPTLHWMCFQVLLSIFAVHVESP